MLSTLLLLGLGVQGLGSGWGFRVLGLGFWVSLSLSLSASQRDVLACLRTPAEKLKDGFWQAVYYSWQTTSAFMVSFLRLGEL